MDQSRTLTFAYDYNQLYLYDADRERPSDGNEYLEPLGDANENGRSVGAASGVVDVLMPRLENFAASMELHVCSEAPPLRDALDHVVEFDLALPSGRLALEGSGGSGVLETRVPSGTYRARLSGTDFAAATEWQYDDPADPPDRYWLELWPTDTAAPPAELRRWQGYDRREG